MMYTNTDKNLLRQSLYYNYDYYHTRGEGPFTNNDYIVRRHVCMFSSFYSFHMSLTDNFS